MPVPGGTRYTLRQRGRGTPQEQPRLRRRAGAVARAEDQAPFGAFWLAFQARFCSWYRASASAESTSASVG